MKTCFTYFLGLFLLFAFATEAPAKNMELLVNEGKYITLPTPASTLFVAEPKIATYQLITPTKILIFGRKTGQTTFMALDDNGDPILKREIVVAYNTNQMKTAVEREFPSLMLKLTPTAEGVIVSGEVPSPQVASDVVALLDSFMAAAFSLSDEESGESSESSSTETSSSSLNSDLSGAGTGTGTMGARSGKVINRLTVTMPTQVLIRIRIAEVSREVSEKLGINWFWSKGTNMFGRSFVFGLADNAVTSSSPVGLIGDMVPDFSALIEAMASENLVSILAEPNLAVTSGETASFLAGGQIPFPVDSGDGSITISYKDYGVMLDVTPTVLSDNRVSLRVRPEVSDVSDANGVMINGFNVPGFIVRRTETTIELASGQSFAIGGLLQNNVVNKVEKIPGIGDVPVLGALFRSSQFNRGETELVIIATAYIGQPSGYNLSIPNANVIIPNAFNRLFIGQHPDVSSGPLHPEDFIYY